MTEKELLALLPEPYRTELSKRRLTDMVDPTFSGLYCSVIWSSSDKLWPVFRMLCNHEKLFGLNNKLT